LQAHQVMKEQILQKALELFNEKGYVEVGVREIARALKISPGNLSYHFNKKEDLLLALLRQFSEKNSELYKDYYSRRPTNANFLELMKKIFESQYSFRGVYIGNQFVQTELQTRDRFDYQSIAEKRVNMMREIFKYLHAADQISISEEDISFLVSHMTLFGRFWISEATLFNKSPVKDETITHYISLLAKQLSLFATEKGMRSIEKFRKDVL